MTTNNKIPWLKIIGWALLIHIILIALSILEVVIFSSLIEPGQQPTYYEQHAQMTAPYVSIIFGIILFFFISRLLVKKRYNKRKFIGLMLPGIYIIMDLVFLLLSDTNWGHQYLIFMMSFITKTLASYIGATTINNKE
ncbi:MAG: hypothetical protein WBM91_16035 [Eudoraea sp.]|jgi:hypothetical protein|uniref:hypothetical protein n=1 Tax=Eudoraea sp. TaxID=1979955 RepID=UPI003C790A93